MGSAWKFDNALAVHYAFTLRENTDKNFYEIVGVAQWLNVDL